MSIAIDGAERLDREQEALVYRVAQEAVRNVIAYADADSVRVELAVDDGVARLVVADDGRGFDPAMREQRLAEGHLGLSLVEELARQSGGSLDDQLERRRGHAGRARGAVPVIRVAVVDDHGVLRDGLAGVIAAQPDMELVATAADGAEAVEVCRSAAPDVVLMDLEMPVMDGIEATRADSRGRARDGRAGPHVVLRPAADHGSARRRARSATC